MATVQSAASERTSAPADRIVEFDIYDPFNGERDLHVAWTKLRDSTSHAIVWTHHNGGHWIALQPELIAEVLSDATRFSSFNVLVPKETAGAAYHFLPLSLNPPEHFPYRSILNESLCAPAVHPLEPGVRALTASLIDGFAKNGRCNFVHDFAEQLPLHVFMQLVDLPIQHLPMLKRLADQFTRPDGSISPHEAADQFADYIRPILQQRKNTDRTDMLTNITRGQVFGRALTDDEAVRLSIQVLVGGLDTVVNFMSFTMLFLAQAPELQARLASEPELIQSAIQECLRRLPLVSSAREVRGEIVVDGVILSEGDMVVAPTELYALNERMNEDPMRFNIDRKVRNHIAFGAGHHICPGQFLARLEMKVLLEEWFKRIPSFELEPGQQVRHRGGIVGGCEPYTLRWPAEMQGQ